MCTSNCSYDNESSCGGQNSPEALLLSNRASETKWDFENGGGGRTWTFDHSVIRLRLWLLWDNLAACSERAPARVLDYEPTVVQCLWIIDLKACGTKSKIECSEFWIGSVFLVGQEGLEPSTNQLWADCSNHWATAPPKKTLSSMTYRSLTEESIPVIEQKLYTNMR